VQMKVGERTAELTGYKLTFKEKSPRGQIAFGVLGPTNEDSGANLLNIKKYLKFFQDEKVDAIVLTGDIGEVADGIARVLGALAESKLPVFSIIGNRECRAEYTDGVQAAQKKYSNIINLNQVRMVEFPEATLVSLPGYHDPAFFGCATGCRYFKSTVEEAIRVAKEAKSPVVLVTHGPPHGEGSQALDYAVSGGNVGDPEITRAVREANIHFGFFSNIKEAGARATDLPGTTLIKQGVSSKDLYVNPGPADSVPWEMNDGTKCLGMAAVVTIKGEQATWKHYRAKPLGAAEKATAKTLDPPPRAEATEDEPAGKNEKAEATPAPAPEAAKP